METITLGRHAVRIVRVGKEIWWVAQDVSAALGSAQDGGQMTRDLPPEEKGLQNLETLGGPQEMVCVTLAGLAILAGRTRTPEAREVHRQLLAGFTGMVAEAEKLATAVAPASVAADVTVLATQVAKLLHPPRWEDDEAGLRKRVFDLLQDFGAHAASKKLLPLSVSRVAGLVQGNSDQVFGLVTRMAQEGQVVLTTPRPGVVLVGLKPEPPPRAEDLAMVILAHLHEGPMTTKEITRAVNRRTSLVYAALRLMEEEESITKDKTGRWCVCEGAPTQRRGEG